MAVMQSDALRNIAKSTIRIFAVVSLIGGIAVLWVSLPAHCDYACKAIGLRRNAVFFELTNLVSEAMLNNKPIAVPKERFSQEEMKAARIGAWAVMESGTIVLSKRDYNMLLIAEPVVTGNKVRWTCTIYPEQVEYHTCPSKQGLERELRGVRPMVKGSAR